eukprot:1196336-Prorocentrum_minimum.AAC.1
MLKWVDRFVVRIISEPQNTTPDTVRPPLPDLSLASRVIIYRAQISAAHPLYTPPNRVQTPSTPLQIVYRPPRYPSKSCADQRGAAHLPARRREAAQHVHALRRGRGHPRAGLHRLAVCRHREGCGPSTPLQVVYRPSLYPSKSCTYLLYTPPPACRPSSTGSMSPSERVRALYTPPNRVQTPSIPLQIDWQYVAIGKGAGA